MGTGDRDAGGGRADDEAVAAAAERDADPLRACVRGAVGVPPVLGRTQLQPAHGPRLHRHVSEPGGRWQRVPQDQNVRDIRRLYRSAPDYEMVLRFGKSPEIQALYRTQLQLAMALGSAEG